MEWIEAAGRIIDRIGTPEFPRALADGLHEIADYDFTVIFG